jgi:hypothetical protein
MSWSQHDSVLDSLQSLHCLSRWALAGSALSQPLCQCSGLALRLLIVECAVVTTVSTDNDIDTRCRAVALRLPLSYSTSLSYFIICSALPDHSYPLLLTPPVLSSLCFHRALHFPARDLGLDLYFAA